MDQETNSEFSPFQLERIARFAAASETLHQNRLLMTTPGMARPTLALAMRARKTPQVSQPALQKAVDAFRALSTYSQRSRRLRRLLPMTAVIAAVCSAYMWGRFGPALAIAVGLAILAAGAGTKLFYMYFGLRPILRRFQLTDEEAAFALDEVIADPRWRAETGT